MNLHEKQMAEDLKYLKENHHVVGIKAEFGTEGTLLEEALRLKEVVTCAGLDLTIKIGGCEAIKDLYDSRTIGVNTIVAPMIESPYAAKKYLQSVKTVFSDEARKNMKFFINIETKYGLPYLEDILQDDCADELSGIVFGRTDMACSLGISKEDINSEIMFKYAEQIALTVHKYGKELVIGGGVSALSLPFFKNLPNGTLSKFETRKVIFDAQSAMTDKDADKGILNAFKFELEWIKNKQNYCESISYEDSKRIKVLENKILNM